MRSLTNNLRQILRRLGRAPMFTGVALITIAIGVGANTAVFSVVDAVLIKPLPYSHPNELVSVSLYGARHRFQGPERVSLDVFYLPRSKPHLSRRSASLNPIPSASRASLSRSKFPVLTLRTACSRFSAFSPRWDVFYSRRRGVRGGQDTAILSYGFWRRKFGGDPAIVGRALMVDGKSRQIIGVLPQPFRQGLLRSFGP